MDINELVSKRAKKRFKSKIITTGEDVFGTYYTVEDDLDLAGLYMLNDVTFFYAALVNIVKEKYSLTPKQLESLAMVDIYWLVKDLKLHSDGNIITLEKLSCIHCNQIVANEYQIDLQNMIIKNIENVKKTIKDDDIALVLKQVDYNYFLETISSFNDDEHNTDISSLIETNKKNSIDYICKSIYSISSKTDTKLAIEIPKPDLELLVTKGLARKTNKLIKEFIDNPPSIVLNQHISCPHCGKEVQLSIENFFEALL